MVWFMMMLTVWCSYGCLQRYYSIISKELDYRLKVGLNNVFQRSLWLTCWPHESFAKTSPYSNIPNAKVHDGFLAAYLSVSEQTNGYVNALMSQYSGYNLVVTGHSLGGALATLSALNLSSTYPDITVYTFGSPRVGMHWLTIVALNSLSLTNQQETKCLLLTAMASCPTHGVWLTTTISFHISHLLHLDSITLLPRNGIDLIVSWKFLILVGGMDPNGLHAVRLMGKIPIALTLLIL